MWHENYGSPLVARSVSIADDEVQNVKISGYKHDRE